MSNSSCNIKFWQNKKKYIELIDFVFHKTKCTLYYMLQQPRLQEKEKS